MRSGRPRTTSILAAALIVPCAAVLSGCAAGGPSRTPDARDNRIDALGQRVVAELKAQPAVADANYDYTDNIDQGQTLSVTIVVHTGRTDPGSTNPLTDLVFKDAWLTPTSLGTVSVQMHAESNPNGDTVAGDDLTLPPNPQDTSDQKNLDAKLTAEYGPYR